MDFVPMAWTQEGEYAAAINWCGSLSYQRNVRVGERERIWLYLSLSAEGMCRIGEMDQHDKAYLHGCGGYSAWGHCWNVGKQLKWKTVLVYG